MLAGITQAAMGQAAQQLRPQWSSRIAQCDQPVQCDDWMFAIFCPQCAAASSKSEVDRSNVCYNFLCWHPIGTYSYIRHAYLIPGSCGDDMGYGCFCMPCAIRRGVTEGRLKKFVGGMAGAGNQEWHVSLFDCDCCSCFEALVCPFCVAHETRGMLQPMAAGDCCFDTLCVLPTAMYGQVRHSYGIVTDCGPMEDLCIPLVCFPCALIRARSEARWQMQHGAGVANLALGGVQAGVAGVVPGAQAHHGNPAYGQPQQQHAQPQQQQQKKKSFLPF